MNWKEKIRTSRMYMLFNLKDDLAKGRTVMLTSSVLENIISWLTTGLFYTSFLMIYGIDIVNVGILTFVPYIASCFSIFSPSILERIEKRRTVLALAKAAYFTLNIFGITIMPVLVTDPQMRIICFVILILLANIINALFVSGYTVWHLNFIPEQVRAEFFGVQQIIVNFIGIGAALISSIIADALIGSPHEDAIVIALRYIAFVLGLLNVAALCAPKEYPYPKSSSLPKLRNIFTMPFKQKKFLFTMLVIFFATFVSNISASSLNYHLLDNVGVSYTYIQVVNIFYPVILLIFMPLTQKLLRRMGWFELYGAAHLLLAVPCAIYAFVTHENYLWLMTFVRLTQHVLGVPHAVIGGNLVYINLPKEDQTNYTAFHLLVTNLATFAGMMAGTLYVARFEGVVLEVLHTGMIHVQQLLLIQAVGHAAVFAAILLLLKKVRPDPAA